MLRSQYNAVASFFERKRLLYVETDYGVNKVEGSFRMKSLSVKLVSVISFFFLIMFVMVGIVINYSSEKYITKSLNESTKVTTENVSRTINKEKFENVIRMIESGKSKKEIMSSPDYQDLRISLADKRKENNLRFLYTLVKNKEGKYIYVIDGLPLKQTEGVSKPGDEETTKYPDMVRVFEKNKTQVGEITQDEWGKNLTSYSPIQDKDGNIIGVVGVDVDATEALNVISSNRTMVIVTVITACILSFVFILMLLHRMLVVPLRQLETGIKKAEEGGWNSSFDYKKQDEIKECMNGFENMTNSLKEMMVVLRQASQHLLKSTKELKGLKVQAEQAMNDNEGKMGQFVSRIHEQVGSTEQVVSTFETLGEQIGNITIGMENLTNSYQKVKTWSKEGERNAEDVLAVFGLFQNIQSQYEGTFETLLNHSKEIDKIIDVMYSLSDATDILALNASVEAEQAGVYGAGFAVVADAVKDLSKQSKDSAERISMVVSDFKETIEGSAGEFDKNKFVLTEAMKKMDELNKSFGYIFEQIHATNNQIKEVYNATVVMQQQSEESTVVSERNQMLMEGSLKDWEEMKQSMDEQQKVLNRFGTAFVEFENTAENMQIAVDKMKRTKE